MKTIAVIGQKGGTGKTTLAQILLVAFDRAGFQSVGIDLDPQTSLCTWADMREDDTPFILPMAHSRLPQTLATAKDDGVQICIIDTAGRAEQAAMKAAQAADLAIVPVQPTAPDLATVEATQQIIRMSQVPKSFAVLWRVKIQGSRHIEAADYLKSYDLEICPATIGERVTYQDAAANGLTPQEHAPDSKAAAECAELFKFTRTALEGA